MSTYEAKVFRIAELKPHPDPETINLKLIDAFGYTVVGHKDSWKVGDLAVYIEPDTIVKLDRPEFSFLQNPEKPREKHRVTVKRLRGVWSEGLLVPAGASLKEGDNAWEFLELDRYEPNIYSGTDLSEPADDVADAPSIACPPKYDIENWKKHHSLFEAQKVWINPPRVENDTWIPGDWQYDPNYTPPEVVITEKIHGENAVYVFDGERMHYRSRSQWKKQPEPKNIDGNMVAKKSKWIEATVQNPWIVEWCKNNQCMYLFGENYGMQKNFSYGKKQGEIGFAAFDVWDATTKLFWDYDRFAESVRQVNGQMAPELYRGIYSKEAVLAHTDGNTALKASHIREGAVVKAVNDTGADRRILKSVSNAYYLKG